MLEAPVADRPLVQRQIPPWAEAFLAAGLAAVAYFALQGELPYHDAARFSNQVEGGAFVWDIAHILLQPTAMLLKQWSGADAGITLKALSSISTAAAVGLFYFLLLRLDLPHRHVMLGTLLLAGCCSVLTLAPSAHPKLVAFPFVTGALLCLCLAERRDMRDPLLLLLGGALLAIAAAFLASALATVPFATLAVLLASRRGGAGWGTALWRATVLAGASGVAFLTIACAGYVLFTGEPLTLAGLTGSVTEKSDLRPPSLPLAVQLARLVFGTINNFATAPSLGATVQAWMRGQIGSLVPYVWLLPTLALVLLNALIIAATYLRTAVALLYGRPPLMPIAFLVGAQAWTVWYGLNDPEHWFQLTAPTIVLFVVLMPAAVVRLVLPAWSLAVVVANLVLYAIPVATYPLVRHERELAQVVGPDNLLVLFRAYPGRASAAAFTMPGVRQYDVDTRLRAPGVTTKDAFIELDTTIGQTLQLGRRVLVADVLDPMDWEAPWSSLLGKGITKGQLEQVLLTSRSARRLEDIGGVKLWELKVR